jgi:uncharacterized protein (TIGR03435 family)
MKRTSYRVVRACVVSVGVLPGILGEPRAQVPAAGDEVRFEVASIRLVTDAVRTTTGIENTPALVQFANRSLRSLIRSAYGVREAVGPAWLDDVRFDIDAKPPAGYELRQMPVLLRNLLADRFKLRAHTETKTVQGFALTAAPGGHRLPAGSERTFLTGRPGLIQGNGRTLAELTNLVADAVAAPVVDKTGLGGTYNLKLEWTPQLSASADGAPSSQTELSIFTALREQMGLRLEPVPVPIDVIVVDSVERSPTGN